jgi:membrane protein YdbS with pleckstrin-like domain
MTRHDRIQLAVLTESPFDRRHGMASVSVDTAGSEAPQLDFDLLTRTDAESLVAQLDAGIAGTEFTT